MESRPDVTGAASQRPGATALYPVATARSQRRRVLAWPQRPVLVWLREVQAVPRRRTPNWGWRTHGRGTIRSGSRGLISRFLVRGGYVKQLTTPRRGSETPPPLLPRPSCHWSPASETLPPLRRPHRLRARLHALQLRHDPRLRRQLRLLPPEGLLSLRQPRQGSKQERAVDRDGAPDGGAWTQLRTRLGSRASWPIRRCAFDLPGANSSSRTDLASSEPGRRSCSSAGVLRRADELREEIGAGRGSARGRLPSPMAELAALSRRRRHHGRRPGAGPRFA
jgi:hypothetical protein